jgi:hypothetical protein
MNSKQTIKLLSVLIAALAGGLARAEGPLDYPADEPVVVSQSRSQVVAQYHAARLAGLRPHGEAFDPVVSDDIAQKSRVQVVAEMFEARRLGLIPSGERDVPVATAAQERRIAAAGRQAEDERLAAQIGETGR